MLLIPAAGGFRHRDERHGRHDRKRAVRDAWSERLDVAADVNGTVFDLFVFADGHRQGAGGCRRTFFLERFFLRRQ